MSGKIIRNSARCHGCGDEIVSTHRHDFVACSCGALFVDGGKSCLRRGFDSSKSSGWTDTSTVEPPSPTPAPPASSKEI